MKLKFIRPKYNSKKLNKIALQIAIEELVSDGQFLEVQSARKYIMKKAKKQYNERK